MLRPSTKPQARQQVREARMAAWAMGVYEEREEEEAP